MGIRILADSSIGEGYRKGIQVFECVEWILRYLTSVIGILGQLDSVRRVLRHLGS